MPIASFANKSFNVSRNKIYTFSDFTLTGDLNVDEIEVKDKKPSSYIKGPGLEKLSFTIMLNSDYGINVLDEINDWRAIRDNGDPYVFILGGSPIGENKFLLKTVNVTNTVIINKGKFKKATLELQFDEYVRPGQPPPTKKTIAAAKKKAATKMNKSDEALLDKLLGKRSNPNAKVAIQNGVKKGG